MPSKYHDYFRVLPRFRQIEPILRSMVLVDLHKHAQKQATQPQSGSVSRADMFLAISIRRTILSIELKRPAGDFNDASKVYSHFLFTRS
jgi:hypothetical protein